MISIIDQISGFVFRIIISRQIGSHGLGMYQISMSFISVLISICCSGIPFVLGKKVAEYSAVKDFKSIDGAVSGALKIAVVSSLVLTALFILFKTAIDVNIGSEQTSEVALYLLPAVFALSVYSCMRGALWGSKRYITHALMELFDQLFRIALGIIMLLYSTDVFSGTVNVAISFSISAFVSAAIGLMLYLYYGGKFNNDNSHIKPILASMVPVGGIRVAGNLYVSLIAVIFPLRLSNVLKIPMTQAIAEYGVLSGMALPMIALPIIFVLSISTSIMPEISSYMKLNDLPTVRRLLMQAYNYSLLFGGLAIGMYLAFGDKLGVLIYNNTQAGNYVQVSCWIMLPLAISSLTTNILNSLGLEYKSLFNYIAGAVIIIACIWILPRYCGGYSIIIGTGVGMSVVSVLNTLQIIKKVDLRANLISTTIQILLFSLLSSLIGLSIYNLLVTTLIQEVSLILCSLLCIGCYLILTSTFNTAQAGKLFNISNLKTLLKISIIKKKLNSPK